MSAIEKIFFAALAACASAKSVPSGSDTCAATFATALNSQSSVPFSLLDGFTAEKIADVAQARELLELPNGDLLVGSSTNTISIIHGAENDSPATSVFVQMPEAQATSVALFEETLFIGTTTGIWTIPYAEGDAAAETAPTKIAAVRTGAVAGIDGDVHTTTSVAVAQGVLFASVGSSCNACTESDPTRGSIQQMAIDGSHMTTFATRIRNAIALTVNPATGILWAGDAGQDDLPSGHPYEFVDAVTLHTSVADYGWPDCEENQISYTAGSDCSHVIVPALEFSSYATHIGAAFYPERASGWPHSFSNGFVGALFVTNHGSWHTDPDTPPSVIFASMTGDKPCTPVDWQNPTLQWHTFISVSGSAGSYAARPTEIAVGQQGSLFVADDQNGAVYRVRPN